MYGSASGTRQMSAVSGNAFSAALGLEDALGGSRVLEQLLDGTARTAHELAAAVGTPAAQGLAGAGGAERAFEGADPGVGGVAREIPVAALAVGAQLQHVG